MAEKKRDKSKGKSGSDRSADSGKKDEAGSKLDFNSILVLLSGKPAAWAIGVFTVLVIVLGRARLYGLIIIDDSFITYTYSKNLAEHGQFVYNLGERVLATTTPLYALLLSFLSWNDADLFYAAPVVNLIFDFLTAYFVYQVIRFIFVERANVIYLVFMPLFFLQTYQMWSSAGGMETSMYVFMTVFIVWLAMKDMVITSGIMGSLLCMTRPDGIIIAFCVMVYFIVKNRSFPWKGVVAFLVASLPWLIFSIAYFGSPIPTGVSAKVVLGADYATPIGRKFKEIYFMHYKRASLFLFSATVLGVLGMGWAVFQGIKNKDWKLVLLVLYFILFNCAFMLTGTAFGWFWYYVPLYLPLYLYAGYLFAEATGKFKPASAVAAIFVVAVLWVVFSKHLPYEYDRLRVKSVAWDQGVRQPCIWASQNTPATSTLMCKTVGLPGYYSNRRVIDPLCIVSPDLLEDYPGKEKAEMFFLEREKPDYFLSWDVPPNTAPRSYELVRENRMVFALISYNSTWLYKKK